MKQLVHHFKTGKTVLEDVPMPQVRKGHVLIQTRRSLVSPGTERMLVEFGKASLIAKARQQPDKVKQVFDKIRSDGLLPTLEAVFRKLDQPIPLGYCNVGTVLAVGEDVTDLQIGDRVASNGSHAEVVSVPRNLVAPVPATVTDNEAAFTVVGAIALQAVRSLNPTLGETVVVIGLGLIGFLTAELLRLNGCHVIGFDVDEARNNLAQQRGLTTVSTHADPVKAVIATTNGVGADGVIIATSGQADDVVSQAARMSRKRGRIVLAGVANLHFNRADFYEKELSFQVSCSYGPGRYDDVYEEQGHDYPVAFVRWTENRNFQAILRFLANGQLDVKPLIREIVPYQAYQTVYDTIGERNLPGITSLFQYDESAVFSSAVLLGAATYPVGSATAGVIGAGNFTSSVLLPALQASGATLKSIASANGLSATLLARKFGIGESTTDYRHIINDPSIDLCLITTRHNLHARMTIEALQAGKHVFVEKPLAIYDEEVDQIIEAQQASGRLVMVGFNRRFSPYALKMKALLGGLTSSDIAMNVIVTVNAGVAPAGSWVHDRAVGGGRILGEVCHFVDLITFLTGCRVASVCMHAMGLQSSETSDSASLLLRYENGSTGAIHYFANGSKAYAKERIEVYSQERTLIVDNFRKLTGYGFRGFSMMSGRQDKGHTEQMKRLIRLIRSGSDAQQVDPLISFADSVNTTRTTLAALRSLRERTWVDIEPAA